MGVFDDKKFEQLDWVSQITETIDSELGGLLARLPDRHEIGYDSLNSFMERSGLTLSTSNVVRYLTQKLENVPSLSWAEKNLLDTCFSLEISDDLAIDRANRKLIGTIALVKHRNSIEEDLLQGVMGNEGIQYLSNVNSSGVNMSRFNEILELVGGCEHALKGRSSGKKYMALKRRLTDIMSKNEWRIRDMALANKVGYWITDYIRDGNLHSLSCFCKLKVMTHNNMPIYSVEEQE